jgi:tetratricopeptide (TPR) repeat protein|tara:strand:- start:2087 stop:2803 length:717 start_codon:yes stop_codon:yes gene_type:complete
MVGLIEQEPILKLKKLFDTKEFDEIITYCHELLKKDEDNLIALQNISTAYIMVGANNDAIEYCEKILEKDPTDEHALKNKVYANEKLENHNEVIICCDKILDKYQNDIDALIAKGIAYNKIGNHEKAMKNYKIVLNNDEKNIDALMNMAVTLKFLKRFDDAIQYYDTIQKLYPNVKRASIEKYESFTELGEKDDAFLAAQGITIDEANKIKKQAKDNEYTIQHAFSLRRFYELEKNNH